MVTPMSLQVFMGEERSSSEKGTSPLPAPSQIQSFEFMLAKSWGKQVWDHWEKEPVLSHACVYTWHGILLAMVTLPRFTPTRVQLPSAIGGLGKSTTGGVQLPELGGNTVESHCQFKQSHTSWGVMSPIILFSIHLYPITVAPSVSLSSTFRPFIILPSTLW